MAKKKRSIGWIILIIVVVAFIFIQFFGIKRSVPQTDPALDIMAMTNPPEEVQNLLHQGCYDCHSYETVYPWYSHVQPVGWFLESHIDGAREHLNFSEWGKYNKGTQENKLKHAARMVEKGKMPLKSYKLEHPGARFTQAEIDTLTTWFSSRQKMLGND